MNRVVDIIFGGNAGSEGKGKFAGFIAKKNKYKHAITNYFPNAGHTWVSDDGEKVITRYLPSSLVNPETKLYLGPGSAIDIEVLFDEIERYEKKYSIIDRLYIHPRAVIVEGKHIDMEKKANLERISSTLKGGSGALSQKIMRIEDIKLARDIPSLKKYLLQTEQVLLEAVRKNEKILIEGAQGFELDINYGFEYPYTTSRQTTPPQLLADSGLPIAAVNDIYCVIRTYPIRVGGNSGPLAGKEIDWEDIERDAKVPVTLSKRERTTVTNKTRRVFENDIERLKYVINLTRPTFFCLNFIQYINYEDYEKTHFDELSDKSKLYIKKLEQELNVSFSYIGTGEKDKHIIIKE